MWRISKLAALSESFLAKNVQQISPALALHFGHKRLDDMKQSLLSLGLLESLRLRATSGSL